MKRMISLGTSLSKADQKKIVGGYGCYVSCTSTCSVNATCSGGSPCTSSQTGVTCGSTYYTNSQVCAKSTC